MKKDFITVSPDNGGTTQVSVVADPNSTFQSRSTTLNFSAGGGVSRAITVNQDGIPLMPVVGLTSLADNWNGSVTLSFNATGFSTASIQNDNGYEQGVSYLSVKMNAQLPSVSEASDTYWVTRGALLLADSFEDVWPEPWNNGVFMETIYKDRPGAGTKIYYDIVQSDPESVGISGFTAHYLRMSDAKKFSPEYHVLQYIRFYLGNPEYQGEYVCVAEFDFT
jgi:hypothetical protein